MPISRQEILWKIQSLIGTGIVNSGAPVRRHYTLDDTIFSAPSTTYDFLIDTLPAGYMCLFGFAVISTPFSGGTLSSIVMTVGTDAIPTAVVPTCPDLVTSPGWTFWPTANIPNFIKSFAVPTPIHVWATSTGDNLDAITNGSVDLYLYISKVQ